jgi:spermidine/putrescine transport system ATP-binding protein
VRLRIPVARLDGLGDTAVRVGVRPEKISLHAIEEPSPDGANTLRGHVTDASFLGVSTSYVVRTHGGADVTVYAQNTGGSALQMLGPGREVVLAWDPPHTFVVAKEADSVE